MTAFPVIANRRNGVNPTHSADDIRMALGLPIRTSSGRFSMVMFNRWQLYIGAALAALAEIIVLASR
jgi:hypothetical protein